jgi:DNA-binding response OmpR family regulator
MAYFLIVEDDELLRDGLCDRLRAEDHQALGTHSGLQALEALQREPFDGVVLDLGLPDLDGIAVLQRIRARHVALPVLVLTARDGVDDRIEGLNAGADDYLTKPFSSEELMARLVAMLRRARLPAHAPVQAPESIELLTEPFRAQVGGLVFELTPREWVLLDLLVRLEGQVVSRESVLEAWHRQPAEGLPQVTNALEVYVHRLRRKLEGTPWLIRNIRGLGYLLQRTGA